MALNVGQDFKKRWLNAPDEVRSAFQDDLLRICELLQPHTITQAWIINDEKAQEESRQRVEQAYAKLKAELIEQARIRRQQALEKSLEEKRLAQEEYAAALQADEALKFQQQTETLVQLRQKIDQEIQQQSKKYQRNPESNATNAILKTTASFDEREIESELDSLRLRLELEAETLIEQAVTVFRAKLHHAAQEEITYILQHQDQH